MKLINLATAGLVLAGLSLAAQDPATPAGTAQPQAAAPALAAAQGCSSKGCPKADQNGQPPLSCEYKSGMATGWQCLLICHYAKSKWGSLVAASYCN